MVHVFILELQNLLAVLALKLEKAFTGEFYLQAVVFIMPIDYAIAQQVVHYATNELL
jgi:hypothetical protein